MNDDPLSPIRRDAVAEISTLPARKRQKVALGVSYEGRDPALLEQMLPYVDYIEVTPETIAEVGDGRVVLSRDVITELRNIERHIPMIAHGVSLSIGSHDRWSPTYLHLLDDLMEHITIAWHSEHLGYTAVDGEHLGIMLALPKTEEALDLVCERVTAIQERYAIPFLIENIVHVLPDFPGEYSDAAFLNAVTRRTGCGLLLDAYNLECDAHNHGLNLASFLSELDHAPVRELHVACGVEHRGLMLDVHSRLTRPCTVDLAEHIIDRSECEAEVVVYEFMPEAVPGLGREAIAHELGQLRRRLRD
jgi:uncharacterized protein (UPF0276 family)